MNLADEIKSRRDALGMSQTDLARLSGVPQQRIAEYENGRRSPTLEKLQALADVLGPFVVAGGVRTVDHYRELFADASTIGVELFARAVYAREHGDADRPDLDLLIPLTRDLRARFGDVLTTQTAFAELDR